ncbi:MAG TPA: hypothetical protein VMV10_06735 [Pirellulales bacterium]|nr:hypothetical protein [Pirellulales bacterium]
MAVAPPKWLLELSNGCTIVVELLSPQEAERPQVYILHNGKRILEPAQQYVAKRNDLWKGENLSRDAVALLYNLQERKRRWAVPGIGEALLYICGEVNIVGSGDQMREEVRRAGLREQDLRAPLVINPSHTLSPLKRMRDKRAWLSQGGLLIHTANIHSGGWGRNDNKHANASRTAAKVWVCGQSSDKLDRQELENGCALNTFDWSP